MRGEANGVGLHAVMGGEGPSLLLLGGWPQNWFEWRYLMLPLAQHFTVIVVDPAEWARRTPDPVLVISDTLISSGSGRSFTGSVTRSMADRLPVATLVC